ncbi:MAG: ATPase domain protein [Bacteroidetes bacterium]|nr:ATPase domain protein [Bacteroidota bacterium]
MSKFKPSDSYIKEIWLELPDYQFEHEPLSNPQNKKWVGRGDIGKRLVSYLRDGASGAYLITGYRGMGKTSFVKRAIEQFKYEEQEKKDRIQIEQVTISFGQKDIKELDILRQIIGGIRDKLLNPRRRFLHEEVFNLKAIPIWSAFVFTVLMVTMLFIANHRSGEEATTAGSKGLEQTLINFIALKHLLEWANIENISGLLLVAVLVGFFLNWVATKFFQKYADNVKEFEKLDELYERCRSQITKEAGGSGGGERFPFSLGDKMVKRFPMANPKEVENDIIGILEDINKNKSNIKRKFIFVFDEIDKIDPSPDRNSYHEEMDRADKQSQQSQFYDFRQRKRVVINILANLKYLITTAEAKFIFIAGREMFDAALADIADRQSAVSSIFHQVINVDSFLKDSIDNSPGSEKNKSPDVAILGSNGKTAGLTGLIEEYLEKILYRGGDFAHFVEMRLLVKDLGSQLGIEAKKKFDEFIQRDWEKPISNEDYILEIELLQTFQSESSKGNFSKLTKYLRESPDVIQDGLLDEKLMDGLKYESLITKFYRLLEHQAENGKKRRGVSDSQICPEAIAKIVYTLQNYVVYLAYRSNGSPKKLVRLIEDMIRHSSELPIKPKGIADGVSYETDKAIVVYQLNKDVEQRYFIRITYLNQYRFGFINYLFRPFLSSLGNYYKSYSDKILVSTPYLLDHIIKFHPFAFSLQNLELIPEVVSETRSPELRNFIEDLIVYLSQNHVRESEIGLFDYKFLNKTYHEIVYLSKLFEDESAAFNFTLDETFHVKLHLTNRIKDLRNVYKEFIPHDGHISYVHSISFLNIRLGDAQFFDQEYDEAIIAYSDALQGLVALLKESTPRDNGITNESNNAALEIENLITYLHLKLKLGLTYEKMKDYEKAMAIYIEIPILANRFLMAINKEVIGAKGDLLQILVQPFLAQFFLMEKGSADGATPGKITAVEIKFLEFCDLILLKWPEEHIVSKRKKDNLTGDGRSIGTTSSIKEERPEAISSPIIEPGKTDDELGSEDNHFIKSTFYSNVGTLLFYKNSNQTPPKAIYSSGESDFSRLTSNEIIMNYRKTGALNGAFRDYHSSSISFDYFRKSLVHLLKYSYPNVTDEDKLIPLLQKVENVFGNFVKKDLLQVSKQEQPSEGARHDKTYLKELAVVLYKLADSLFICLREPIEKNHGQGISINKDNPKVKLKSFKDEGCEKGEKYWSFNDFDIEDWKILPKSGDELDKNNELLFQLVMCMYFWAGQIQMRIGKNMAAGFMFRKIMLSFRTLCSSVTLENYLPLMEDYFLKRLLQIASWNSGGADRYQIYKYKHNFGIKEYHHPLKWSKHNYLSTSASPEVKEAIILFSELKLKALQDTEEKKKFLDEVSALVNSYCTVATQFVRYHELRLQYNINECILKNRFEEIRTNEAENILNEWDRHFHELREGYIKKSSRKNIDRIVNEIVEFILPKERIPADYKHLEFFEGINNRIVNSIFCLYQIIRIYNGYGLNYIMSLSSLGNYHRHLGTQLKYYELSKLVYESLKEMYKDKSDVLAEIIVLDIESCAQKLLGADIMRTIDTVSEYQLALQCYTRARQMHVEGAPYYSATVNMFYLEDDFNDSLYHFSIAVERQRINSGNMRNHINELQQMVDTSQLYKYVSYVNDKSLS